MKTDSQDWLTPQERKEGEALQVEYDRLSSYTFSLSTDGLITQRRVAQRAFSENPTEANFAELKRSQIEYDCFHENGLTREVCREAIKNFVAVRVYPWANSISARGLVLGRAALAAVLKQEQERNLELTGRPLQKSDIVDAAKVPVQHLEEVQQRITSRGLHDSPDSFFAAFAKIDLPL